LKKWFNMEILKIVDKTQKIIQTLGYTKNHCPTKVDLYNNPPKGLRHTSQYIELPTIRKHKFVT